MKDKAKGVIILSVLASFYIYAGSCSAANYYVAADAEPGGDGTPEKPWNSFGFALQVIPEDADSLIVKDGVYTDTLSISKKFKKHLVIKAENPGRARIINEEGERVQLISSSGSNFTLEGFEVTNLSGRGEYLVLLTGNNAQNIVLKNNIFHDSFHNDMVKINAGAHNITVTGNIFYNMPQENYGVQFLDVNVVYNVVIQDNIFFTNYKQPPFNAASSHIVIKNSTQTRAITKDITVQRNIFLNWQGKSDQPFLLLGEDAWPFYEAEEIMVQNNLFLGNSKVPIEAAFGVKGCRGITFRANTVSGDLPCGGWAYATRINREGKNLVLKDIYFYNNIWADPTGTMKRFSCGGKKDSENVIYKNNLYWNGGKDIPGDCQGQFCSVADDPKALTADPLLNYDQENIIFPEWDFSKKSFSSGNKTIREEFERLVNKYGAFKENSPARGKAEQENMPAEDILGNPRGKNPDIGAFNLSK